MENTEENSEKIGEIQKKIVIRFGKYGRKISWIPVVKRYGKYGRKVSWIVKWFGKFGRKVSWIVEKFGK